MCGKSAVKHKKAYCPGCLNKVPRLHFTDYLPPLLHCNKGFTKDLCAVLIRNGKSCSTVLLAGLVSAFLNAGCQSRQAAHSTDLTATDSALHREWKPENQRLIAEAASHLQTGDIALRTGADATSHALRAMNQKSKTFSHCGIVSIENGQPWIYHSIGGEDNPDARIQRETPDRFFSPQTNEGGGICRRPLTETEKAGIIRQAQTWFREGRTFDMNFDLATDTQLYCAEFVYKAFVSAGFPEKNFSKSHTGGFEYVAVDDLYTHPTAKIIWSFRYK